MRASQPMGRKCGDTNTWSWVVVDVAFRSFTELNIPFGKRVVDGLMVRATEVDRGLACGCVCAKCGVNLVAKLGEIKQPHFAHDSNLECKGAFESAIHSMAKQIISEAGMVRLPPVTRQGYTWSFAVHPDEAIDAAFDRVEMEQTFQGFRPDIVGFSGNSCTMVEVAVTHFCDDDKIGLLYKGGHTSIEIDIGDFVNERSQDVLVSQVLFDAPRKWLFNSDVDALILSEQKSIEALRIAKEEAKSRAMAAEREAQAAREAKIEEDRRIWIQEQPKRLAAAAAAELERQIRVNEEAKQENLRRAARFNAAPGSVRNLVIAWNKAEASMPYDEPFCPPFICGWQDKLCRELVSKQEDDDELDITAILKIMRNQGGCIAPGLSGFINSDDEKTAVGFHYGFQTPFKAMLEFVRSSGIFARAGQKSFVLARSVAKRYREIMQNESVVKQEYDERRIREANKQSEIATPPFEIMEHDRALPAGGNTFARMRPQSWRGVTAYPSPGAFCSTCHGTEFTLVRDEWSCVGCFSKAAAA